MRADIFPVVDALVMMTKLAIGTVAACAASRRRYFGFSAAVGKAAELGRETAELRFGSHGDE